MSVQSSVARRLAQAVVARPIAILLGTLLLAIASALLASRVLHINTNQLDLISQELRQVKDIKRVIDMVGGTGHMIVALRGADEQALKQVADDVAHLLEADKEHVREVTYKVSTGFIRDRAALFMSTEDLTELRRRGMAFLQDRIRRANPFFIEIEETKPVELKVDDLIEKYTRVGKKSILDDYYISLDRKMIMVLVKPAWATTDIGRTGEFLDQLRQRLAEYDARKQGGIHGLVEDYGGEPSTDGKVVQYGFTGSYVTTHDDSFNIQSSVVPVGRWAFLGVVLVMLAFFGRRVGSVAFVLTGLVSGIAVAFGFAAASVGELNMITSILAGILMGTGIDFGIFLIYRMREELGRGSSPADAVVAAIENAGPAAFVAALGTAGSFFSLAFSDFRGFSQFGVIAGAGVFLIALTMYVWIPSIFLSVERWRPGLGVRIVTGGGTGASAAAEASRSDAAIPRPGLWLAVLSIAAVLLSALAPSVIFDYDSRELAVPDQPSIVLQDELNKRFTISAEPVAIASDTVADVQTLWKAIQELPQEQRSTFDQVVSLFSFVPPADQQERNAKILAEWKAELSAIDPAVLPDEYRERWAEALHYLDAQPYTVDDIPPYYRSIFESLPTARPENRGFLTFVYPSIDVWDGSQMRRFVQQVETIRTPQGQEFHAAGVTVLMSTLSKIVLKDAKMFVVLTALLLIATLLLDTRSVRDAAIALVPLVLGMGVTLGFMALVDMRLNFINVVVFPILLGFGISQGVYLIHRFREGTAPLAALRSVGAAVACSTLTTLVGWAALLSAAHRGLQTMGALACVGMTAILLVSFTIMPTLLQILHNRRVRASAAAGPAQVDPSPS